MRCTAIKVACKLAIALTVLLLVSHSILLVINGVAQDTGSEVNDQCLPDKIYAFPRGENTLYLNDLWLEEKFVYYLHIESVTEHVCTLDVTLTYPDGNPNHVFSARMGWGDGLYKSYDIPMGMHYTGNYSFRFDVDAEESLNLLIKLEKRHMCLENIVPNVASEAPLYKVMRFQDKMEVRQSARLKSDTMYRVYLQRVTPVADPELSDVMVDFYFESPDNISYRIFNDHVAPFYTQALLCHFGTATEGLYRVRVKVVSKVEFINVAYAIVEYGPISSMCVANNTGEVQIVDESHKDEGGVNCTEGDCDSSNSTSDDSTLNATDIDPNNPFGATYEVPVDGSLIILGGVLIAVCAVVYIVFRGVKRNQQKLQV